MSGRRTVVELLGPLALIALVGLVGTLSSASTQIDVVSILVQTTIVISIYVFTGNSGVISFGHVAFVAVGAFTAGVLTIPATVKPQLMPQLFAFLRDTTVAPATSLVLAAAASAVLALVVAAPLMRLAGLAAGIATFAVLEIVHNVLRFWEKIGPGATTLSLVPTSTSVEVATLGTMAAAIVAYAYQRSTPGRLLRASREDAAAARAAGIRIHAQRYGAFVLSAALAGFAGGLLVHALGSITTEQVYLQLTFVTLAMLVVGGMRSLWGATVGAVLISALDIYLARAENGMDVGDLRIDLPDRLGTVVLGLIMVIVLIVRPAGVTGGREFRLPARRPRAAAAVREARPRQPRT